MNNSTESDLSTLDRDALARMVGELEEQNDALRIVLEERQAERDKLLAAITKHHSQKADDRCWLDDDDLYAAAGLPVADRRVGDKLAMLENCKRFIERRCEGGGWPTYAELEAQLAAARAEAAKWKGRAKLFHEAYTEKDFESLALGLQKMQLEASGADVILPWQNRALRAKLNEACRERNRLRAVLAQVGEKVKAEAISEILRRQTDDTEPPFRCTPYSEVLRQIANAVSGIDVAAIVAASAETANE